MLEYFRSGDRNTFVLGGAESAFDVWNAKGKYSSQTWSFQFIPYDILVTFIWKHSMYMRSIVPEPGTMERDTWLHPQSAE